jgi:hypothetical protein
VEANLENADPVIAIESARFAHLAQAKRRRFRSRAT